MARAALTPIQADVDGENVVFTPADANGHSFPFTDRTIVLFKNTDGSPHNVTLQTPGKAGGLDIAEDVIAVPATTGFKVAGRLGPAFNQGGGVAYVDYAATTGMSICVIEP